MTVFPAEKLNGAAFFPANSLLSPHNLSSLLHSYVSCMHNVTSQIINLPTVPYQHADLFQSKELYIWCASFIRRPGNLTLATDHHASLGMHATNKQPSVQRPSTELEGEVLVLVLHLTYFFSFASINTYLYMYLLVAYIFQTKNQANYIFLGLLLRKVSKKVSYKDYIEEKIFYLDQGQSDQAGTLPAETYRHQGCTQVSKKRTVAICPSHDNYMQASCQQESWLGKFCAPLN